MSRTLTPAVPRGMVIEWPITVAPAYPLGAGATRQLMLSRLHFRPLCFQNRIC